MITREIIHSFIQPQIIWKHSYYFNYLIKIITFLLLWELVTIEIYLERFFWSLLTQYWCGDRKKRIERKWFSRCITWIYRKISFTVKWTFFLMLDESFCFDHNETWQWGFENEWGIKDILVRGGLLNILKKHSMVSKLLLGRLDVKSLFFKPNKEVVLKKEIWEIVLMWRLSLVNLIFFKCYWISLIWKPLL